MILILLLFFDPNLFFVLWLANIFSNEFDDKTHFEQQQSRKNTENHPNWDQLGRKKSPQKNSGGAHVSPLNNKTGLFLHHDSVILSEHSAGHAVFKNYVFFVRFKFSVILVHVHPKHFSFEGGRKKWFFFQTCADEKPIFSGCRLNFKNSKSSNWWLNQLI